MFSLHVYIITNNYFVITEAASNYAAIYETIADILTASVKLMPATSNNKIHQSWTLSVHSNNLDWHEDLKLLIRLTNDGHSEFGGVASSLFQYQEIHAFPSVLAKGVGWMSDLRMQLRLEGVSVTLAVKNYTTEILFTVTDE